MKIARIEFIATFNAGDQIIGTTKNLKILQSEEMAKGFFMGVFATDDRKLVKVSMCIYDAPTFKIPKWYSIALGKLWFD